MVTRPRVFWRIAWRSLVSCIGGGAAIGAVFAAGFVIIDAFRDVTEKTEVKDIALVGYIGGAFGLLLGIVAAVVLGLVAAFVLVPYPGAQKTRRVIRTVGMILVGLFSLLFLLDPGDLDAGAWVFLGVLFIGGQVGAYLLGGWIVAWYIRRCESAAAAQVLPADAPAPTEGV